MIQAFEVSDGLDSTFCANQEEVDLVVWDYTRRLKTINQPVNIQVEIVHIRGFLKYEQDYIARIRQLRSEERTR